MTEIERVFHRVSKTGDYYMFLFDENEVEPDRILKGAYSSDRSGSDVGRIFVHQEGQSREYFFSLDGLQCCLLYYGWEPKWFSRNMLGVQHEPIRDVNRIIAAQESANWEAISKEFDQIIDLSPTWRKIRQRKLGEQDVDPNA